MLHYLSPGTIAYLSAVAFLLGSVIGSAINCLAYRMVHHRKWTSGRSACTHCGHTLAPKDLIPVLSYLLLKGKCRYCGAKLEKRYVLTEILLGLAYVSVVLTFGITFEALSSLVLVTCLLALSLVDLDIQIIPHRFLVIPAAVQLVHHIVHGHFMSGVLPAVIFGGGLLVMSLIMDKILKKDTMGGGDIKLMAVLGLYFSIPECLLLLILSCMLGIAMAAILMKAKPDTPFPFAPALSLAAWVTLLVGHPIIHWYLGLFT